MNSFEELCTKISQDIDAKEIRSRSRTEQEQISIVKKMRLRIYLMNFF
jgi:hypothetical protein